MQTFEMLSEINGKQLDAGFWHNVLPFGKFYYRSGDGKIVELNIDDKFADALIENFDKGATYYVPFMNLDHGKERYGEVKKLEKRKDGIYVFTEPTDGGKELLKGDKYKYLSAEFGFNYLDKKTGKRIDGPVYMGHALTNRPAHPDAPRITLSETPPEGGKAMDDVVKLQEELNAQKASVAKLTEEKAALEVKLAETAKEKETIVAELSEIKGKLFDEKKKAWVKEWQEKGIPPATMEEISKFVLSEDDMAKFTPMLEKLPKVQLNEQRGSENAQPEDPDAKYDKLGAEIASFGRKPKAKE